MGVSSQRPCKRVPASLRDFVSVLATLCVDTDRRFIGVLRVRSSALIVTNWRSPSIIRAGMLPCTLFDEVAELASTILE